MNRLTLLFPPELKLRAQLRAEKLGIPLAEFVRRAVEAELKRTDPKQRSSDPLFTAPVWTGEAPDDLSWNHDHYLYDGSGS